AAVAEGEGAGAAVVGPGVDLLTHPRRRGAARLDRRERRTPGGLLGLRPGQGQPDELRQPDAPLTFPQHAALAFAARPDGPATGLLRGDVLPARRGDPGLAACLHAGGGGESGG